MALAGCHSAYIAVTIENRSGQAIELLEVDYPSASFGTQNLLAGAEFHYRFKVLGSGGTTMLWTDAGHKDHKSTGPSLKEGDEGQMVIVLTPAGSATWSESLKH